MWDASVFGLGGRFSFTDLTQPWLKESAKAWVLDDVPRRRGKSGKCTVGRYLKSLSRFTESLRLGRPDDGVDHRLIGRGDIAAFLNRLSFLQQRGAISACTQYMTVRDTRGVLSRLRTLGLTTPGQQQERVRTRFPDTPVAKLKLLPAATANPHGAKAITSEWMNARHRTWVKSLPELLVSTVIAEGAERTTAKAPFDKARIFPYAYRHTYAQRHADAGVPPDVLQGLMDHRNASTTQRYYRVGHQRRREAVERVTAMQFDRHGTRTWRQAQTLLESEHARRAIGAVQVPYGTCTEPSNVAAGGHDCPVRFRCVGCGHFRTDISYLPDLEAYLADLLRNRERLAAFTDADAWAKAEALPSDEEIARVRHLVQRLRQDLNDLTDEERAQIQEAVAVVRRSRTVSLGIPRTRQPLPDLRPDRATPP